MGVSVRQQKRDGRWYVWVRYAGDRAAKKFDSEEEAKDVAKAVRNKIALGEFDIAALKAARTPESEVPPEPTLAEFYKDTVAPLWSASISNNTFDRYETSFRLHINPELGDLSLSEVTRDRLKSFVVSLTKKNAIKRSRTEEGMKKEADRKLSKDSIRNIVAALRAALTEAVDRHLLATNPASKLGKLYREAGQVREEVDPFTVEEIPAVLETTLANHGFENYVVLLTFFHTGLRSS